MSCFFLLQSKASPSTEGTGHSSRLLPNAAGKFISIARLGFIRGCVPHFIEDTAPLAKTITNRSAGSHAPHRQRGNNREACFFANKAPPS